MITDITLENFKGFRHLEIQPKRITAFVGPNGTGKSSVLQAFGLLKQTVEMPSPRRLTVRGQLGRRPVEEQTINALRKVLIWQGPLVNLPSVATLTANCGRGNPLFQFRGSNASPEADLPFDYSIEFLKENTPATLIFNESGVWPALKNLKIVPALRGFTQPSYKLCDDWVKDVSLEPGAAQREAQTATNLCYAPEEVERVSRMLKAVTGVDLKAVTVPRQSVALTADFPAGPVNIVAEGFGTNSLVMLLLQLVAANRGATVMIEEPEIHLHPKAQADLAEVLAAEALAGNKQVIMTTHSEHITGRLLTLVAERTLTPEDLAIYAFAKDAETGVCTAKPLTISGEGGIEGGIRGFFDVSLAEMNRYVEAQFAQLNPSE